MTRVFRELLDERWKKGKHVCVGLDPDPDKIPEHLMGRRVLSTLVFFCQSIIDATAEFAAAFKPNIAFFEQFGANGLVALNLIIDHTILKHPEVPIILDAKRADIGNSNTAYVKMMVEEFGADAITVHPYLGREAMGPFLERGDKGVFALCRTSNPGAGEFQDLEVVTTQSQTTRRTYGRPLYEVVALHVSGAWNKNGNCGVVAGATSPDELKNIRKIVGDMPILIPGIGKQGGDLGATIRAAICSDGQLRGIINSSRDIIFASQGEGFADAAHRAARNLHDQINGHLKALA